MNDRDAQNPTLLLLIAAGVVFAIVVTHVGRWLAAAAALVRSPLVPVLAGAGLAGLVALLLARQLMTRRGLRQRVRLLMLPADTFDPAPEAVVRFAASLVRARCAVRGIFDGPASAVRVRLDTDTSGRLRYVVELPRHARAALRTAAAGYGGVELRELQPDPAPEPDDELKVVRAELVLARRSVEPLRAAGLDPDPLAAFARALDSLTPALGEAGVVCVDLLPLTPGKRLRLRRRLLRDARREFRAEAALFGDGRSRRGRAAPAELVRRRADQRALSSKLGSPEPLFTIQVLLRVAATNRAHAKLTMHALLAAFDAFAGENHFRASGVRLPGGPVFLGADVPWRRRGFDRRARSGLFKPARRRFVTATEIAGLLKPPSVRCAAANVLRSGGVIPPAPPGLPTFDGQPGLLPLGRITTIDGERMVGVPLAGTFFSYMAGRSRYGKTETALGQFVHLARSGHGCFFLDPHEDAIERAKHYLTDPGVRERVIEINLATHHQQLPGWNLLAPAGRPAEQILDAVVDSFASAMRWDEHNTRALNLTTQATQALIDLARHLPAELAPTIFQIPTLLGDDEWRAAALPYVSPPTRQFFEQRFPRLAQEAITPVTHLIDRLRVSPTVAALLGNPRSSYNVRAAMDQGLIVLACPGPGSVRDRLVANFLVYDMLHAAKTRATIPPERRRPFYVFLDEVQTYDGATGGNLAALLEQTAKYGLRATLLNQSPERLTPETLNALTTNRSHLLATTLNARAAGLLTREWGGAVAPEVLTRLRRYTFLASITLHGDASAPFLIQGSPLEDLYPDHHPDPDALAALEAEIDRTTRRQPLAETLRALANRDERIREALTAKKPQRPQDAGSSGARTV